MPGAVLPGSGEPTGTGTCDAMDGGEGAGQLKQPVAALATGSKSW
ncbi:hypothetical protein ACFXCU_21520 [Streptomyces virginiae]|nr:MULTISPECIES: hypothetical protein [unclassified Streptomyces]